MKATGLSKKEMYDDDTGLGSYGIGKFAPFAVSQLRTIFVSTVYREGKAYMPVVFASLITRTLRLLALRSF
jgi:hypothetical protein